MHFWHWEWSGREKITTKGGKGEKKNLRPSYAQPHIIRKIRRIKVGAAIDSVHFRHV